ncbi:ABC transporter permease [Anaerovorax odorimutans]|uniref:ABC transporter permease n=1 Tax=Anaerovorax odorimutans TaxID=109327 RepID=A0ABT1RL76_9FIRM|nr:ABC transporter permease [Anaerovorax odorimutans]MCQ4635922.1 ABC transporter permease [Anaerovorax odorimutans]
MSSKKNNSQTMKMFHQIALKNVKNNLKNYMIYFLTLTLGVALFYTFNSINAQFSMMNVKDTGSYLTFASGMILAVSLFICVIMGFLVSYANRFLMRKRKKELGLYITLGIEQKMISKLIQKETFFIGVISLAIGLAAGIFLSQGLALISMRLLGAEGASYHFVFSPLSAVGAVCFFGLLFVVMYKVNNRTLKKYKLIDLLYAEKKNESFQERSRGKNLVIAACGIVLMIAGYLLILRPDAIKMKLVAIGIIGIAIGTFFFFWALSGILMGIVKKNKKSYYSGINLFSAAQIASKLKTTNLSLSIICVLLFLSVSSMTVGLGMGKSTSQDLEKLTPYDATLSKVMSGSVGAEHSKNLDFAQELESKGVRLNRIGSVGQLAVYDSEGLKIKGGEVEAVALSDYNKARTMQGLKPIKLPAGKYVLSATDRERKGKLEDFLSQEDTGILVNGKTLTAASDKLFDMGYTVKNVNSGDNAVVVPDSVLKGLTPLIIHLNINYRGDKEQAERMLTDDFLNARDQSYLSSTKNMVIIEITSTNLMLSYMAIYLGITFMICACVVLALQQMGEAEDNRKRYKSLKQLGVRSAVIRRSVLQQIGVYFGFPLILALIHGAVITIGFYLLLPPMGAAAVLYNICFALIVTCIIYGSYFFLTYLSGKAAADAEVSL